MSIGLNTKTWLVPSQSKFYSNRVLLFQLLSHCPDGSERSASSLNPLKYAHPLIATDIVELQMTLSHPPWR